MNVCEMAHSAGGPRAARQSVDEKRSAHRAAEAITDALDYFYRHAWKDRKNHSASLRVLAAWQGCSISVRVGFLEVGVHDPAPRGDPVVEHSLHHLALFVRVGQEHTVTLPVGARPLWFAGHDQT